LKGKGIMGKLINIVLIASLIYFGNIAYHAFKIEKGLIENKMQKIESIFKG
jgi:hypothetical protein